MRASIDGSEMWLAVADTAELRSRGLMGITDIAPLDGMIFIFESDTSSGFWMKDTLIPLDIAWFTRDGELVRVLTMVPCESDPCPSYAPGGDYLYAVEVPAGAFAELSSTATLDF